MNKTQIVALLDYLKIGGQVLQPEKWKQRAITANYVIASIPALCIVLNVFGITDIKISAEDASIAWQAVMVLYGIGSNVLLSVTSKHVSINPLAKQ